MRGLALASKRPVKGRKASPAVKGQHGGPRANSGGARPGAGRKREERRIADFEALGEPPADQLDGTEYAYKHLLVSLRQIATDKRLTDRERRQEIRATTKAMAPLVSRVRLRQAERLVRGELDREKNAVDPQMEPAPPAKGDE